MPASASAPAQPPSPQDRARLSRRGFLSATALAAGAALVLPGRASAATPRPPAGRATVTWSSESTAAGYAPKSATWYTHPATGLASVPYKLSRQNDIPLGPVRSDFGQVITVDPAKTYQKVLGIGSSMEDSTIHNLSLMSPGTRARALQALFHPEVGAGFSLTRICFGSSDFSHSPAFYTYDDGPADPTLANFSIQQDIDNNIISTLQQALQINPGLAVVGTAWSAPAWMKDNNSLIDGNLLDQYIPTLATYYRMIVQAYARQGIHIHAVTPQNEPGWPGGHYPSMLVSASQEEQLIDAMRAEFDAHGIKTEIWAWDWNFGDLGSYVADALGTSATGYTDAYRNASGIAFHDYSGDPSTMSLTKTQYPDLQVCMTERMLWGTSGADRIARYLRSWSTGYIAWVTLLDQNRQSQQYGNPDPTPLIQDPADRDTYWALPEYYLFAQFSKFIQPGARRIWSDYGNTGTLTTASFLNPDGTVAAVVVNGTSSSQDFTLRSWREQLTDTLPAKTVGTYTWTPAAPLRAASDAYATIQAAAYSDAFNVAVEVTGDTGGGEDTGWINSTSWLEYDNVDFGTTPATQFQARIASGAGVTGQVEVRLDSLASAPVASIPVHDTGGWQTWITMAAPVAGVTGVHTVYLTFASAQSGNFVNLHWLTFTHDTGTDAYATIQAAAYDNANSVGVETTGDTGGGADVGWINSTSWLEYDNVDFGTTPATQFQARVASGAGSGVTGQIQVRLDSLSSTPVGSISVSDTGGWQTWVTETASLSGITGTHTVYLTFASAQSGNFVNLHWLTFTH